MAAKALRSFAIAVLVVLSVGAGPPQDKLADFRILLLRTLQVPGHERQVEALIAHWQAGEQCQRTEFVFRFDRFMTSMGDGSTQPGVSGLTLHPIPTRGAFETETGLTDNILGYEVHIRRWVRGEVYLSDLISSTALRVV